MSPDGDWSDPSDTDIVQREIYLKLDDKTYEGDLASFGNVIRNLQLSIVGSSSSKISLVALCMNKDNYYIFFKDTEVQVLPGLWFIFANRTDSCKLKVTLTEPCTLRVTYDLWNGNLPRVIYDYSNSVDTNEYQASFSVRGYDIELRVQYKTKITDVVFSHLDSEKIRNSAKRVGEGTDKYIGYDLTTSGNVTEALLLMSHLHDQKLPCDYVLIRNCKCSCTNSMRYIERTSKGYRACYRVTLIRESDAIGELKLSNVSIPSQYIDVTLNGKPHTKGYVNIQGNRFKEQILEFKTIYYFDTYNDGMLDIFDNCRLTCTAVLISGDLRREMWRRPAVTHNIECLLGAM